VRTFARFAATPIGPGLAARDGGLTLTTLGQVNTVRMARSDIANTAGACGVEFVAWGDDPQSAIVGVCTSAAALTSRLGSVNSGIGWDLDAGTIKRGNSTLKSGLPAVGKQQIVGIALDRSANKIRCYLGQTKVWEGSLPLTGALHFAASLASSKAGGLALAVNAGQWIPASPAAATGWAQAAPAPASARIADRDYLNSAPATRGSLLMA